VRTKASIILVLTVAASVAFLPLSRAGAGGFCMDTMTESFTDAVGTEVVMVDNCFTPTVTRVDAGDAVTFTNKDGKAIHAVGGPVGSFGDPHGEIMPGESVSYRFDQEGTFPYVCIYHPGMAGAVVVGDGEGPAFEAGSIVSDADGGTSNSAVGPVTGPTRAGTSRSSVWLLVGGLLAAAVLALLVVGWARRSHVDPTVEA
jgi:plastocyanin